MRGRAVGQVRDVGRGRLLAAMSVALALSGAWAEQGGGMAMAGPDGTELAVACVAADAKGASGQDDLCALFAERLAVAFPGRKVVVRDPGLAADVALEMLHSAPRKVTARMIWSGRAAGEPLGTARAGADLDTAALSAFLDALIAANPPP